MAREQIGEAFGKVCMLAGALGVKGINALPGCWEHAIDGTWWIALNGHAEPTECSRGASVPPYEMYVECNGWPAGILSPGDGVIAAGEGANEDTLIAAIDAALAAAKGAT